MLNGVFVVPFKVKKGGTLKENQEVELCCLFLVVNEPVAVVAVGVVGLSIDALNALISFSFVNLG